MPYANISSLPEYVKKYSPKMQRMWMHTFNSTWNKLKDAKDRESRAFRAANSVVKKRMEQHGANRYGYNTHFMILVDRYLKNLEG